VIFTTSFLAKGIINKAVGNAMGKENAHAFIQIIVKFSAKPMLMMVMKKDMAKLMPTEMTKLIRRLAYFG
jgi:hypothetical protein